MSNPSEILREALEFFTHYSQVNEDYQNDLYEERTAMLKKMRDALEGRPSLEPSENCVLQLCSQHASLGGFSWRATIATPSRYRCPICEPQQDHEVGAQSQAVQRPVGDDRDDPEICGTCNGSGQGQYDGWTCSSCNGKGVKKQGGEAHD